MKRSTKGWQRKGDRWRSKVKEELGGVWGEKEEKKS